MRMAIGTGAVLAVVLAGQPAAAFFFNPDRVAAPWCLHHSDFSGMVECAYYTYQQCMETRLGVGGYCQPNPARAFAERYSRSKRNRR
jgi:hypothetical protein